MSLDSIPGVLDLAERSTLQHSPLEFLEHRFRKYGPIFKTHIGVPAVVVVGREVTRQLLGAQHRQFGVKEAYAQTPLAKLFEDSLFCMDHNEAKEEREALRVALGRLATRRSHAVVSTLWAELAQALATAGVVDALEFTAHASFRVATRTVLGMENVSSAFEELHPLFRTLLAGAQGNSQERLDDALAARAALMERLEAFLRSDRPTEGVSAALLAHAGQGPAALRRVAGQLLLLLWAGYDTTAAMASWALLELSQRPQLQDALHVERSALPAAPSIDELQELPLLGAVLKEVERLHPTGVMFPRVALQEARLLGHDIPAGTLLIYSAYLTHRDPAVFERPDDFVPERWLAPAANERLGPLFGFGHGARLCLGQPFALLHLRTLLSELGYRYEIELAEGAAVVQEALPVNLATGVKLRFRPRS